MSKRSRTNQMKLKRLIISELYNAYDYSVVFNDDITFIYGMNGCGKTTVLNITEAIITGRLFKLFDYKFKTISLEYYKTDRETSILEIKISMEKRKRLLVEFEDKTERIEFINLDLDQRRALDIDEIATVYYDKYSLLNRIRQSFNYVFLPLNRTINYGDQMRIIDNEVGFYRYSRQYKYGFHNPMEEDYLFSNKENAVSQIEQLVYFYYNRVNSEIREIESRFRSEVLQSLLNVDANASIEELAKRYYLDLANRMTPSKIAEVRKKYISILRELKSRDEDIQNCELFFEKLAGIVKSHKPIDEVDSWFKYNEFSRMQRIVLLAEKTQKDKEIAMSKILLFRETMNSFISQTEEQKSFVITADGRIGFKTKWSDDCISPQHLSSGEKQLLIFFANLIFNVDTKKVGIFVVDEPELSLHLSWQRIFVEKTIQINPNMQLIFATHSPEFIGKYRDRMFKLEKMVSRGV